MQPPCTPSLMRTPNTSPPSQDQVTAPLSDDQWRSMADLHNATGVRYILGLNLVVRDGGGGMREGGSRGRGCTTGMCWAEPMC